MRGRARDRFPRRRPTGDRDRPRTSSRRVRGRQNRPWLCESGSADSTCAARRLRGRRRHAPHRDYGERRGVFIAAAVERPLRILERRRSALRAFGRSHHGVGLHAPALTREDHDHDERRDGMSWDLQRFGRNGHSSAASARMPRTSAASGKNRTTSPNGSISTRNTAMAKSPTTAAAFSVPVELAVETRRWFRSGAWNTHFQWTTDPA